MCHGERTLHSYCVIAQHSHLTSLTPKPPHYLLYSVSLPSSPVLPMGTRHTHHYHVTVDNGKQTTVYLCFFPDALGVHCVSMSLAHSQHQKGLGGIPKDLVKEGRVCDCVSGL